MVHMLILLKKNIKTSFVLLLFMTMGTYLFAYNPSFVIGEKRVHSELLSYADIGILNPSESIPAQMADSLSNQQKDSVNVLSSGKENSAMYSLLARTPINFRINSAINYRKLNNFMREDARELFFQGWLKEVELQKLSRHTDSLRKAYSAATAEEREKISAGIIEAEQKSMALYDELPEIFQKAREIEDRHWQSASSEEITQFQRQVIHFEDSIARSSQPAVQTEVHDTITLYTQAPVVEEKKAEIPTGIVYKVQIGSFKGKIPDASNKLIKKLSIIRKVENHVDEKGYKIYTTGNLRSHAEAVILLGQVKQEGVKNAVITAYQNGKKIPVTEAKTLNKEL